MLINMDTLLIEALTVSTHIGVYAFEQRIKQTLFIDISIPCNFSACGDDLANTIDYDVLCQTITNLVESQSFQLIETVANEVAKRIQEQFKVPKLRVAVTKPCAIKNASKVQVIVER